MPSPKSYDATYFARWYRDRRHRVTTPAALARKVRLTVGIAEQLLERPVRSVLDIGCGEAPWRAVLRRLRPSVRYVGVDSSAYAVQRYGASRGIIDGSFGTLSTLPLRGTFDLIVVCDVLQYIPDHELPMGLAAISARLGGVAYLEAYTTDDQLDGDKRSWHHRSAAFYRRQFARVGLTHVGMHCWVGDALRENTTALERAGE
ncbi:MAG: class I SAM-dependent methyltransferase [Gemmatimonadaceae bacterium]|nr:class I SAM-dependent methyltransferase [Gemmatimonadaceae bacterium]